VIALLVIAASFDLSPASALAAQGRVIRVVSTEAIAGQSVNVSVEMDSQGNENAVGFSLNFDSAIFSNASVSLGSGASGASLNSNASQAGSGRIGIALAFPSGQAFTAGARQLAIISLAVAANAPIGPTNIGFGDQPITREVSDVSANALTATYTAGVITVVQPNPTPIAISLNPSAASAGGIGLTLGVSGLNFVNGAIVRWNGSPRNTTFVSGSQLTALISSGDLANSGAASVTVLNPAPGGGISNSLMFSITNPVPALSNISPTSALAGSGNLMITVNGSGFSASSRVRFNGADLPTSFVSGTQLTATIPASSLAAAGTASITVFNPAPGGGTSGAAPFTINNPVPSVTTLSPASATAGGAAFTLMVNGANFVSGSTVRWNGGNRVTTFIGANQLSAAITAADVASAGAAGVTVANPAPGGGASNAVNFTVVQPNPVPGIASLRPSFAIVGGPAFTLTVNGSNFTSTAVVRWNDSDRPTTFVNANQLRAAITAADIANPGTANVRVFNPAPGGGLTGTLPLIVAAQVTSVSAASFLGAELAADSIIAGFGVNLATRVEVATTVPLPTDLAGSRVSVKDSLGMERLSPQFFVAPGQINYHLPPGTAEGEAVVLVTSGDNKISVGGIQVTRVAPGVFTANANGLGVAAAIIVRVKPDNSQTTESVARFDSATNRFVSVPIDMGPETDQVFLVIFGTGFRSRSSLSAASAQVGGLNSEVLYAGPAPGFVGLDQSNIRLSRSLIGRGEVDVVLTVDGKVANTVRLNIR
jgi:uncharacterized protein (TIGR03437 family)